MIESHFGELAALATAVFWTFTAVAFEFATKKIGSLSVNLIRLVIGFILLSLYSLIVRGELFPTDANQHQWIWLSISGFVGFVLGDLFLFKSYGIIGSRVAMLMMALSPPFAALIGWAIMGETLNSKAIMGMAMTFSGIAWVILGRKPRNEDGTRGKIKLTYSIPGLLLALGGSLGQATGLVLSKFGMAGYDAFAATQIRVLTGMLGFIILFFMLRRWNRVRDGLRNKKAMVGVSVGSFFGPFLGVSFSLLAVKHTSTGIASAIMSIVPILIIPFSIYVFKEQFRWKELLGAVLTVGGVILFFL